MLVFNQQQEQQSEQHKQPRFISGLWACASSLRACASSLRACASGLRACASSLRACALALVIGGGAISAPVLGQDDQSMEEIVVVGTQIRGASISDALAVSVLAADVIETLGVDSGDELLQMIPENGQNFFNEAENSSGGVNSGRGDVGAFNLRNLGTGNTLVLLNGRRMVNSATYQTEEVGGSFVPVNTVNSQTLPIWGIERVEVLRDGASAIYGADAVAGVLNTVLQTDYEGMSFRVRYTDFDFPGNRQSVTGKWGQNFNEGRTNVSVFLNYYQRDRVKSAYDDRWGSSEHRDDVPPDSRWANSNSFRNTTTSSFYPRLQVCTGSPNSSGCRMGGALPSGHSLITAGLVNAGGGFVTYPTGDTPCEYQVGDGCARDGTSVVRYDWNAELEGRDLFSDLTRLSLFSYINHSFDNGMESFTELMYYQSESNLNRHAAAPFSHSRLILGKDNPHNPFGSGAGRLSGAAFTAAMMDVPAGGYDLRIVNYRFPVPRIVDNDGDTVRLLQGLRGTFKDDWDWEAAILWSKATKDDITHNRISNTLAQEALNSSDLATAYNPFSTTREGTNIDRLLVDVYRKSETTLTSLDFKVSHGALFDMPGGSAAGLIGVEWREESFEDDRDPRLDGTTRFTDNDGDTYPLVSDVVNSSPTPDNRGDRKVTSLFLELQMPLLDNLDMQLALRHERFSDISDNTTVGKMALGYRPHDTVLLRGSWSQTFRAPNLITINETMVTRSNNRDDWTCHYANNNRAPADQNDPSPAALDCEYPLQRTAIGSDKLKPETSENLSLGIVYEPTDWLTLTADYWQIVKEDTIGLFGEENHTLLDLAHNKRAADAGNCATAQFNPSVDRIAPDADEMEIFMNAGLCPVGRVRVISDIYVNLNERELAGYDLGIYIDLDTNAGNFNLSYNGSFYDKIDQGSGGSVSTLLQARADGTIPTNGFPIAGFGDLIGRDGYQDQRHNVKFRWSKNEYAVAAVMNRIGDFYQSSLTLNDGTRYRIPAFTTLDMNFDYRFEVRDTDVRARLGIKNIDDSRAPLADRYYGFFADAHTDLGRYWYLDFRFDVKSL